MKRNTVEETERQRDRKGERCREGKKDREWERMKERVTELGGSECSINVNELNIECPHTHTYTLHLI